MIIRYFYLRDKYNNLNFIHYDVADQHHNPQGKMKTVYIRHTVDNQSIDRIILWSVFTHMYEVYIRHYLNEFGQVLTNSGFIYATVFVVDEEILEMARATNLTCFNLRFEHKLSDDCFVNDPIHPLGAITYRRKVLHVMILGLQNDFDEILGDDNL